MGDFSPGTPEYYAMVRRMVGGMSENEVRVRSAQDWPAISLRLLSGGELWWDDAIKVARENDAALAAAEKQE